MQLFHKNAKHARLSYMINIKISDRLDVDRVKMSQFLSILKSPSRKNKINAMELIDPTHLSNSLRGSAKCSKGLSWEHE